MRVQQNKLKKTQNLSSEIFLIIWKCLMKKFSTHGLEKGSEEFPLVALLRQPLQLRINVWRGFG